MRDFRPMPNVATSAALQLLIDPPAAGGWNMGVDEALMEEAAESGLATLRFYEWSPATLSLGYFQAAAERDAHVASRGCNIVRRSSGGGAILHDQELTYSISLPTSHPLAADPETLYRNIHSSIVRTLAEFGVAAEVNETALVHIGGEPFLCFERRAVGDLVLGGAKICGSAQRRRRGAILQHGSVLLERSRFAPELPGVRDLAPASSSAARLTAAQLIEAWSAVWRTSTGPLEPMADLSDAQTDRAQTHVSEKYGNAAWTNRR